MSKTIIDKIGRFETGSNLNVNVCFENQELPARGVLEALLQYYFNMPTFR